MSNFSMSGRVVLVTGASGTLGRHFARVMVEAGASVMLAGRRYELVVKEAEQLGARAMAIALDITKPQEVEEALNKVEERIGLCDVLINNAGIALTKPAIDMNSAEWLRVLDVNLHGAFICAQAVAKRLKRRDFPGCIVNIASILGKRVIRNVSSYAASKAALLHLTRVLSVEWAHYNIRVNAIAPGYIVTDINESFFQTNAGQNLIKRVPQRRLGTVDDLTGPLLLLASEAGRHMTGSTITVDGGHSIASL